MVFHSRSAKVSSKKIELAQFAPYAVHLAMVLAVAVYVIGGAIAIRKIEATPVKEQFDDQMIHTPPVLLNGDNKDDPFLSRSRDCVLNALRRMATGNCTKIKDHLDMTLVDMCYLADLKRIPSSLNEQEEKPVSNNTKSEIIDGYEYWTLMDSVLFCFTVITTIGYGNVAPRSFEGRLFVIIYGLIGVPFTMMAIANIGKFLATLLKSWTRPFLLCCRRMKRKMGRKGKKVDEEEEVKETQRLMESSKKKAKKIEDDISSNGEEENEEVEESEEAADNDDESLSKTETLVLFFAFVIYIVIGSIVIAAYEPEMDFFEAIYFNFVTLTTIGLGDLVPQSEHYLAITLIYCAIGLALTTIAIEIAADTLKKLHYFGRKIDNVANVQVWFGGQKISMKALVKNLGDQFNVPVEELEKLNLGKFVDDAMKVEAGEMTTLRNDRAWMNSNYWRAIESGSMHYVDDDDLVTLQSNLSMASQQIMIRVPYSLSTDVSPTGIIGMTSNSRDDELLSTEVEDYSNEIVVIDKPETQQNAGPQRSSTCLEMQQLLQAFNDYKNEINAQDGRWSEEARRRYLEYQRIWSKFRTSRDMK